RLRIAADRGDDGAELRELRARLARAAAEMYDALAVEVAERAADVVGQARVVRRRGRGPAAVRLLPRTPVALGRLHQAAASAAPGWSSRASSSMPSASRGVQRDHIALASTARTRQPSSGIERAASRAARARS